MSVARNGSRTDTSTATVGRRRDAAPARAPDRPPHTRPHSADECEALELRRAPADRGSIAAPLLLMAVVVPGIGSVAAVVFVLWRPSAVGRSIETGGEAFAAATVVALILWAVLAFLGRSFTTARGANGLVYGALENELATLDAARRRDTAGTSCHEEAEAHLNCVRASLAPRGPAVGWAYGTSYVHLWRRLHRAEEALFETMDRPKLAREALHDARRVKGSRIPEADELFCQAKAAAEQLSPEAARYLPGACGPVKAPPADTLGAAGRTLALQGQNGRRPTVLTDDQLELLRGLLRGIRRSVNEFRDDRREGIVRARLQLSLAVVATGTLTYLLFGLALLSGRLTEENVVAVAAFYLVAAVVGLFRRLGTASERETVGEEDYGLSFARLIHTPLFSGVAGVAGVYLTAALAGAATADGVVNLPSLADVYSLDRNSLGLVVAAVFGLTPNLLIRRLEQQAETYKADLRSSRHADGKVRPEDAPVGGTAA